MVKSMVHTSIGDFLDKKFSGEVSDHPFYTFEPWDCPVRSQRVLDIAKSDGIDLYNEEMMRHLGSDPRKFQTGYLLSTAKFRTLLAGSRTGKTYPSFIELGIMISGEKPVSLRFPKNYNTKVRRVISPENVRRFGRFDSSTGEFLDYDDQVPKPQTWDEWNCGTIHGAGVYPDVKICPDNGVIWVGTTHKALWEFWWPRFTHKGLCLFPEEFLDKRAGAGDGLTKSEWTVHCLRGIRITIISYESDPKAFEAIETHAVIFDEESKQKACVTAAINHTRFFSMVMTPYNGMTYTKKMIFNDKKDEEDNQVFHATSYDSPYLSDEMIQHRRSLMEKWEIGARIWGLHTELKGQPYYDRAKINKWIRTNKTKFLLGRFIPCEEFDGIISRPERSLPGLMNVKIRIEEVEEENQCDTWRIYEKIEKEYAYYVMADSAEGSDIPSEAGDVLASLVMRFPDPKKSETFPQIVASLRSTMKTANFARCVSYATRYYQNALMCAEGPARGSYNALFYAELRDYPYWFLQTTLRDSTRKIRGTKGFDTNAATRIALFDGIREVLDEYTADELPEIRDEPLLRELAACVIDKTKGIKRPNHTNTSTLDTTICYGQGIFIWRHYSKQVKDRSDKEGEEKEGFLTKYLKPVMYPSPPVYLGEQVEKLR